MAPYVLRRSLQRLAGRQALIPKAPQNTLGILSRHYAHHSQQSIEAFRAHTLIKWTVAGATTGLLLLLALPETSHTETREVVGNDHTQPIRDEPTEEQSKSIQPSFVRSSWGGLQFLKSAVASDAILSAMSTWQWPVLLDFSTVKEQLSTLLLELSLGPGSLYSKIVSQPPNPEVYPEVEWDAEVRLGDDICMSERAFFAERRRAMRVPFARLMGVSESEINELDLPIVAIAGSGGGYRAMLNTIGSLCGAEALGILPCTSYTAGVSGSCWALSVLYSGVAGSRNAHDAAAHLKDRIQTSYLDFETLDKLIKPPTNEYLLSSLLRKASSPSGTISLVDLYGTLLSSRLFVPSDLTRLNPQHLSLHLMRRGVDKGQHPLPILTAIQHAVPPVVAQAIREVQAERSTTIDPHRATVLDEEKILLENISDFLWYEFTPYEIGCDEIGAWIPSWSFGRRFLHGRSIERQPELGTSILSGIFGSAFCASLKLYFREVEPTLEMLPVQLYEWLKEIITENEMDLALAHPVLPDQVPNFLRGLEGQLRSGSPPDITDREHMTFMDAGAELNIPYYPLLRRNVDCIIALDASADSQDLWFTRAEELAAKRGLRTWPKGAGWPVEVQVSQGAHSIPDQDASEAEDPDAQAASLKLAQTQETALTEQTGKQADTKSRGLPEGTSPEDAIPDSGQVPLSTCEVWIGSSKSHNEDSSRLDDLDEDALLKRDGIGIVYIPLAPNERKVPGFDPFVISTWRREVTADESQALLDVAEANFEDSKEKIVKLLRAIWLRKKHAREQKEWEMKLHHLNNSLQHNLF